MERVKKCAGMLPSHCLPKRLAWIEESLVLFIGTKTNTEALKAFRRSFRLFSHRRLSVSGSPGQKRLAPVSWHSTPQPLQLWLKQSRCGLGHHCKGTSTKPWWCPYGAHSAGLPQGQSHCRDFPPGQCLAELWEWGCYP